MIFVFFIGDIGVTDGKFEQSFASCQKATENQDGAAQLLYLACLTFIDLQSIQQFINLFPCLLYSTQSKLCLHCTEQFTLLSLIDLHSNTSSARHIAAYVERLNKYFHQILF